MFASSAIIPGICLIPIVSRAKTLNALPKLQCRKRGNEALSGPVRRGSASSVPSLWF